MIQQQLANRQTQLWKELEALSLLCRFCLKAEEEIHGEILNDSSKCKNDICIECYKLHKNEACKKCAQKIETHFPKGKLPIKQYSSDEAAKLFNRQFKIRSNQQYQILDQDFINLLCYFHSHQHVSARKKYDVVELQIKKILQMKLKDQKTISVATDHSKNKHAKVFQRKIDQNNSGIQSCGYNKRYDKGLNLIRMVWGYPALSQEQFVQHSKIIKSTKVEENCQLRMIQQQELKLIKNMKMFDEKDKDQTKVDQFQNKVRQNLLKVNLD